MSDDVIRVSDPNPDDTTGVAGPAVGAADPGEAAATADPGDAALPSPRGVPAEAMIEQAEHFLRLDGKLPCPLTAPSGDVIVATLPGGAVVHGVHTRTHTPATSPARLWAAAQSNVLAPIIGGTGTAGMHALLSAWRDALPGLGAADSDSSCAVTWPSVDVAATRAFLDHGMTPAVVIAVRGPVRAPAPPVAADAATEIRRATYADYEAVIELALAEMWYSSLVGAPVPANAADLRTDAILGRLADGAPLWLALRDGTPVGLADCGYADVDLTSPYSRQLPAGRWGYVNCLSVTDGARGGGVGAALVRTAHAAFADENVVGSFLFYTPANPLSSVFWPRRGYRPLWTMWETRPATALR